MFCELCQRKVLATTKHHLVPRAMHSKKRVKRLYGDRFHDTIAVCSSCRRQIHTLITEKEMAFEFNNLDALRRHPGVTKFLEWIKDKPADCVVPAKSSR